MIDEYDTGENLMRHLKHTLDVVVSSVLADGPILDLRYIMYIHFVLLSSSNRKYELLPIV